jgi:flagellar biosynthesis protein FlhA
MDGASKFVRGDAVAGLIITSINLLVGVVVGALDGLTLGESAERYARLTIGDGLVSQIPALFVSTAAAVLTTRATGKQSLGQNLAAQIGGRPQATAIVGAMMFLLAFVPGMPKFPFLVLGGVLLVLWRATRGAEGPADLLERAGLTAPPEVRPDPAASQTAEERQRAQEQEEILDLLKVDRVALEIGYRLIPLVQDKQGTGILDHIAQLRKRVAAREGVVLPPVRIKDNVRLEPGAYRILIGGNEVAKGSIDPGLYLAMDGGSASGKLRGKATTDPAFGLPAWWIAAGDRDEAEILGYAVIDATSVLVTHLSEVLRGQLHEILSREDVRELVENAKRVAPTTIEGTVPEKVSFGLLSQVLRNLLRERVPVRNVPAIVEALADGLERTKDVEALTEAVRQRLGRSLCELHGDKDGVIQAVTLDPTVEAALAAAVGAREVPGSGADAARVGPAWLRELVERVGQAVAEASRGGRESVLVVRSNVRRFVSELVRASLPKVSILSYGEVAQAAGIETHTIVKMED